MHLLGKARDVLAVQERPAVAAAIFADLDLDHLVAACVAIFVNHGYETSCSRQRALMKVAARLERF